jgi:hypothetical protein
MMPRMIRIRIRDNDRGGGQIFGFRAAGQVFGRVGDSGAANRGLGTE